MMSIKVILVLGLALTVASEQVSKDGARYICICLYHIQIYIFLQLAGRWSEKPLWR